MKLSTKRIKVICDNCGEDKQMIKFYIWLEKKQIQYICDTCGIDSWFVVVEKKNI